MLIESLLERSFSFPYVCSITIGTLELVYDTTQVFLFVLVFRCHESSSNGVIRLGMCSNPSFPKFSIQYFCESTDVIMVV